MLSSRQHNCLTPIALARALSLPFLLVPGGVTLMFSLAAATVGLDPAVFIRDLLADSAVILSPLALKCALIWASYTALYLTLTWAYWPHYQPAFCYDRLDPGLSSLLSSQVCDWWRALRSAMVGWLILLRRRSIWRGIRFAWSPGVHPQIE